MSCNMSVPEFADLGKVCKDFFTKGFYLGMLKLKVKNTTDNGVETTTTATHDMEDQTASADFEIKKLIPNWGLTTTGKWTTKNIFSAKLELQDKLAQGLKLCVEGQYTLEGAVKAEKIGALYKIKQATFGLGVDGGDETNILLGGSSVFAYKDFLAGCQVAFDANDGVFKNYDVGLCYTNAARGISIHTEMIRAETISAIVHYKVNCELETAVQVAYTSAKEDGGAEAAPGGAPETIFSAGVKYAINPATTIKAMVDSTKTFTAAFELQVLPGATMTLCNQIGAEGAGKLGLALEFGN